MERQQRLGQPTPNPPGPANQVLSDVSCTAINACSAVGNYDNVTGAPLGGVILAEQWDGATWSVQPTQSPAGSTGGALTGVSCAAPSACTAVGAYTTYGGNPPAPAFGLAEVTSSQNLAIQPTANPAPGYDTILTGVSCTSGTACMAVGYDYYNQGPQDAPYAEERIGTTWKAQSVPAPAGAYSSSLSSVSCPTTAFCVAVGSMGVEQWDGTAWTIPTIPTIPGGGGLTHVSCPTTNFCLAVGGTTQAEEWNGHYWTVHSLPVPADASAAELSGVSCVSPTSCMAVGSYNNETLAEQWNGSTWTIPLTPNPATFVDSGLASVSCTSATTCTAVGAYENQANKNVSLVLRYKGYSRQLRPHYPGISG
jgi:hypothetical protein